MKRLFSWTIVAVLGTSTVGAQQAARPDFSPLEFLVGSCWVATFPDGKTTDTHCFEWVYDKTYIRDRHVVNSTPKYEGETLYAWDRAAKRIGYRYWSNDGMVLDGYVDRRAETILFPSFYTTPAGVRVELEAEWTRLGTDAYRATQRQRSGAEWKPLLAAEYRRKQ